MRRRVPLAGVGKKIQDVDSRFLLPRRYIRVHAAWEALHSLLEPDHTSFGWNRVSWQNLTSPSHQHPISSEVSLLTASQAFDIHLLPMWMFPHHTPQSHGLDSTKLKDYHMLFQSQITSPIRRCRTLRANAGTVTAGWRDCLGVRFWLYLSYNLISYSE